MLLTLLRSIYVKQGRGDSCIYLSSGGRRHQAGGVRDQEAEAEILRN